jgi:hypothetical protein
MHDWATVKLMKMKTHQTELEGANRRTIHSHPVSSTYHNVVNLIRPPSINFKVVNVYFELQLYVTGHEVYAVTHIFKHGLT